MSDQLELLSVQEVADELRISDTTVYRLISTGQMPHIKMGGRRYLVTREQLRSFLDAHSVQAAPARAAS